MKNGLVHIYYGDGKGKTTAAIGLGVRAAGQGVRVHMAQFLKDTSSGELNSLKHLDNFSLSDAPKELPFYFQMSDIEKKEYKKYAVNIFNEAKFIAKTKKADLVIFDELLDAISLSIISEKDVVLFLTERAKNVEVVLTGREAGKQILELADYVSEMKKKKHPYDEGVGARKGIEF